MSSVKLEHVNVTVRDPHATAAWMQRLFGWRIRWEGPGMQTGYTIHVGSEDGYIALFSYGDAVTADYSTYKTISALNHIAVVVDDLEAIEQAVKDEGFKPMNHGDYEPGIRFYFEDSDGLEIEVVSYH